MSRVYEIRVRGYLGADWEDWFEGLRLCQEPGGVTVLCGVVVDQAALHGLLGKLRDLNLELISLKAKEGESLC